ncbi:Beta-ketoacyl synthase, C-terminal domain, partial [Streptomyces zhaozhouensis]
NVGHSLAGSGVVSLISLVQGMRKRTIPASIHCDEVNDYIRWDDSPFYVNRETREWPEPEDGRLVGAVSSFGMSGTNAHIVVESHDTEADISARTSEWPTQPAYLLALSAKTPEALRRRIADLADYLEARPGIDRHQLTAISAELLDGRHHFGHRCAVVVRDGQDAAQALRRAQEGESGPGVFLATVGRAFSPRPPIQQLISELAQQAATLTDPAKYQENLQVQADLYSQGFELRVPPRPTGRLPLALPSYPFLAREFRPGGHERREEATAEAAPASAMPVTVPETGQAPGRPSRRKAAHRKPAQPRPRPQPKHRATSPARPKPTAVGLSATADAPPARTATVERAAVALAAPGAARGADGALGKPHGVALSPLGSVVTQRLDAAATARAKPDGLVLPPLRPVIETAEPLTDVSASVVEAPSERTSPSTPPTGDDEEAYRAFVGELVVSLAAELYVEPEEVALDMTFTDLGLDSIVGVEWIRWVNQRYGLSVESTRIYQYPTVPEFARFLWGEVGGVVASGRSVEPVESVVAEVVGESEAPVVAEVGDEGYRDLLGELVVSLAAELYVEPEEVALDMTFTDLGLDSIVGVEWIRWVNQRYGLSVESTRIYQHPTLSEFGRFLMGELAESGNPAGAAGGGTAELDVEQVLERVYSGELSPEQAEELLTEIH